MPVANKSPFYNAEHEDFRTQVRRFLEREIVPNIDGWETAGILPRELHRKAADAGLLQIGFPESCGGTEVPDLFYMVVLTEELARAGSGGLIASLMSHGIATPPIAHTGTQEQKDRYIEGMFKGTERIGFGLTEPLHGSDATFMETTAVKKGTDWTINGMKRFNTGMHTATVDLVFARTSGKVGEPRGISAFLVPVKTPGFKIEYMWWTFNMPSDHAEVSLTNVTVPGSTMLGEEGRGLDVAQTFVHENRIRQAASSLGAAQYCIDMSVAYAKNRKVFGKALATNQAIQFPLAELHTEAEMTRGLVRKTAWHLDREHHMSVSEWVAMSNYRANRLVCDAADRAMQVHGGIGYSRHTPFEHIYRHHRRYRITEGSEEIQIRRVAGTLFGFWGAQKASTEPKVAPKA